MTLESAIIHAEEVADRCAVTDGNRQCEDEHRQLAAWLRELKERRKEPEIVRCGECEHRDPEDKKCDCGHAIIWQLPRDDNWYCADAERRTDGQGTGD